MHAIEIAGLRKVWRNGLPALRGIDLSVTEGDFFALLGANGAGKSTTIGILSCLILKTGGKVRIFGHDLDVDKNRTKSMIGIVPQEVNFSQFETCLDIIVNQGGYYGVRRKLAVARAEKYMRLLGLWERRDAISMTLSGGMKRRLMIARALVHEPRLLLLDEPTTGVDVELRRSTWNFLTQLNQQGISILLTTHYLEEAERLCGKIAIIDAGEIIVSTTMKELLSTLNKEILLLEITSAVHSVPEISGYPLRQVDNAVLEVEISQKSKLNQLFSALSQHGIDVKSVRNKSNRLEELFLSLVIQRDRHGK